MTPEKMNRQQEFATELNRLMQENPDLPVVPMVNTDVCSDDSYSSWAGSFGEPRLDRKYDEDERIYFESVDFDTLVEQEFGKLEKANNRPGSARTMQHATQNVRDFDWEPVITVYIDLPA